jgi:DNA-binding transcriptional ArsR family regulator
MKVLKSLIGSGTRAKILLYLSVYKESYPRELTINLRLPLFGVQSQLKNLLKSGIILVRKDANRNMFRFNPDHVLRKELLALLKKAMAHFPEKERAIFYKPKLTPRSTFKK